MHANLAPSLLVRQTEKTDSVRPPAWAHLLSSAVFLLITDKQRQLLAQKGRVKVT